jgi:hypothetical protein
MGFLTEILIKQRETTICTKYAVAVKTIRLIHLQEFDFQGCSNSGIGLRLNELGYVLMSVLWLCMSVLGLGLNELWLRLNELYNSYG